MDSQTIMDILNQKKHELEKHRAGIMSVVHTQFAEVEEIDKSLMEVNAAIKAVESISDDDNQPQAFIGGSDGMWRCSRCGEPPISIFDTTCHKCGAVFRRAE